MCALYNVNSDDDGDDDALDTICIVCDGMRNYELRHWALLCCHSGDRLITAHISVQLIARVQQQRRSGVN